LTRRELLPDAADLDPMPGGESRQADGDLSKALGEGQSDSDIGGQANQRADQDEPRFLDAQAAGDEESKVSNSLAQALKRDRIPGRHGLAK
jgi:hypothetical protein